MKPRSNSQKSFGFKEQLRIGGALASKLTQVMSQTEVARRLGISQQMVSRIERRALYKIQSGLKRVVACPDTGVE
jgi:transcriptional regulator